MIFTLVKALCESKWFPVYPCRQSCSLVYLKYNTRVYKQFAILPKTNNRYHSLITVVEMMFVFSGRD